MEYPARRSAATCFHTAAREHPRRRASSSPESGPGAARSQATICCAGATEPASSAPVGVVETDDVVLAQVRAGLDLDEVKRDVPGVLQSMLRPARDVGGLVLAE